jgi:DNA mismatch repair protein MSH6
MRRGRVQVLECDGAVAGSVLAQLDHCVTPGGKRTLRAWLTAPLQSPEAISRRQDAVEELLNAGADAAATARTAMRACGDIERAVVRLAAAAVGALGRDAPGVVLYEDTSRRKVKAVTTLLAGLESVRAAVEALQAACVSEELKTLCSWGDGIPDFREALKARAMHEPAFFLPF